VTPAGSAGANVTGAYVESEGRRRPHLVVDWAPGRSVDAHGIMRVRHITDDSGVPAEASTLVLPSRVRSVAIHTDVDAASPSILADLPGLDAALVSAGMLAAEAPAPSK
jgi:hypothetical protein